MLVLRSNQQVRVSIQPVDAKGNPASVDGTPAWGVADPNVLTVEADADGLGAVVKATGVIGSSQVSVSADADLGEGVSTLTGTLEIDVVGGQAVALNIGAGAVEDQA